jgi:hypothetical protein
MAAVGDPGSPLSLIIIINISERSKPLDQVFSRAIFEKGSEAAGG